MCCNHSTAQHTPPPTADNYPNVHGSQKVRNNCLVVNDCGVKVRAGVSNLQRTALRFVYSDELNDAINCIIVPLHGQHTGPTSKFIDDTASAHRGGTIRERLLKTGVSQTWRPALSPDLNPIENLWDQLNPNDLWAALQEEWDTKPQGIKSQLVNSMRHCCQAVFDAQGHTTH